MRALKKSSRPVNTQDLLKHPLLWRGQQLTQPGSQPTVNSGFSRLDKQLPGHGWPLGGLTELLLAHAGIGELRLLLPALTKLQSSPHSTWSVWINPPFVPYAPALQAAGINPRHLLLVHPKTTEDFLWALEAACKSVSCGAVLAWPVADKLKPRDTRRIQIAAKQGQTLACLFRPLAQRHNNSMAELRLALHPGKHSQHLLVDIIKRRGGWPIEQLHLTLTDATDSVHTDAQHVQALFRDWQVSQQRQMVMHTQTAETDDSVLAATIEANLHQAPRPTTGHALH